MTCPSNPAAPAGYAVWRGAVPAALSAWAVQLLKTVSRVPFGTIWTQTYQGVAVLARKDYHTWHYQSDGTLLTGICWPGITLYKPTATSTPATGAGALPTTPAPVVTDPATSPPDPTLAVYDPQGTDWGLVALSAGALVGTCALFALALHHAGSAAQPARSQTR